MCGMREEGLRSDWGDRDMMRFEGRGYRCAVAEDGLA